MDEYQKRFEEEYVQLKERLGKLRIILRKYYDGTIDFKLNCPVELLEEQEKVMSKYLRILDKRKEYDI